LTTDNNDPVKLKVTIISVLMFISLAKAYPQQLSQQVLLPAAGVIFTGSISYSQTIGEVAVEIIKSSDYTLTQGFQQPKITILPGVPPPGTGVKAYPNPVRDYVNIEVFGEKGRSFRITVSNTSGIIVYSTYLTFNSKYWYIQEIPVANFSSGLYFIQVVSTDGVLRRAFKVEKI
jgi:hypothetical protein